LDFSNVLHKVIEVGGTVLQKCTLRHGHRALHQDKTRALNNKLKTSQRIESNREKPIHPHAVRGWAMILGREVNAEKLPYIDSDASTESEGEGGNTDDDLSEFDISEFACD
jgi:hypothetical protein